MAEPISPERFADVLDRERPWWVPLVGREQGTGLHVCDTASRFMVSLPAYGDYVDARVVERPADQAA